MKHLLATTAAAALLGAMAGQAQAASANIDGFKVTLLNLPKCAPTTPAPPVTRTAGYYYSFLEGTQTKNGQVITDPWYGTRLADSPYAAVTVMNGKPGAAIYKLPTPQQDFWVRWGSPDGSSPTASNRLMFYSQGTLVGVISARKLIDRLGQPAYHQSYVQIHGNQGRVADTVVAQTNVNAFEYTLNTQPSSCP